MHILHAQVCVCVFVWSPAWFHSGRRTAGSSLCSKPTPAGLLIKNFSLTLHHWRLEVPQSCSCRNQKAEPGPVKLQENGFLFLLDGCGVVATAAAGVIVVSTSAALSSSASIVLMLIAIAIATVTRPECRCGGWPASSFTDLSG